MATPLEQLERRLTMMESELRSYEASHEEALSSVNKYAQVITELTVGITDQKKAISQLKAASTVLSFSISDIVARDILCRGKIYCAIKSAEEEIK